jgi:hypothetical protein
VKTGRGFFIFREKHTNQRKIRMERKNFLNPVALVVVGALSPPG